MALMINLNEVDFKSESVLLIMDWFIMRKKKWHVSFQESQFHAAEWIFWDNVRLVSSNWLLNLRKLSWTHHRKSLKVILPGQESARPDPLSPNIPDLNSKTCKAAGKRRQNPGLTMVVVPGLPLVVVPGGSPRQDLVCPAVLMPAVSPDLQSNSGQLVVLKLQLKTNPSSPATCSDWW